MAVSVKIDTGEIANIVRNVKLWEGKKKKAVITELRTVARLTKTYARRKVPVDTGRLRSSITAIERKGGLNQVVGSNVEYAAAVEFGGRGRAAKPYLYPAFERYREELKRNLDRIIKSR